MMTKQKPTTTEGKFTIKYPKGYDPELKKFITAGAGKNVVVEKLPAAKQAVRTGQSRVCAPGARRGGGGGGDGICYIYFSLWTVAISSGPPLFM